MGANIVVCTSIDIDDYEDIHFEGVAISRAGVLSFETKAYMQSSGVAFRHGYASLNFVLVLLGSNRGADIGLGTFSTVCAATTVPS